MEAGPAPPTSGEQEEGTATGSQIDEKEEDKAQQKPPYSYAQLIVQALLAAKEHKQTLSGIYNFIADKYPFYKLEEKGWKVSRVAGVGGGGGKEGWMHFLVW